jgi:hypothetical protein
MSKEQFESAQLINEVEVRSDEVTKLDDISLALVGGGDAAVEF